MTAHLPMRLVRVLVALGLTAAAAGCGVPTGGAPDPIAASDVPYGLASPTPPPSAAPTAPAHLGEPLVYLVAPDGALVARARALSGDSLGDRLGELLDDLAGGPTTTELTERLSTALRPDATLSVSDLSGATVTIDLRGSAEAPTGRESRRAVAQIVLTATSLPGVEEVLLTRAGERIDAPLPSGELTSQPLTAADYTSMLTATPTPTAAAPP